MKLIIVDDHSLFRNGLATLFTSQPDFEVVGEAGTIRDALSLVESRRPDLVLMDLGLSDGSGIDAIPKMLQIKQDIHIVILTIHGSDENAFAAIRLGAKGFLIKDISAPALLSALRHLEQGELAIPRSTLSRFVEEYMPFIAPRAGDRIGAEVTLTLREIEVLAEISGGASNAEIARTLSITENTAKVHVHNILHKLKLQTRQDASAYARRLGLVRKGKEIMSWRQV